MTIRSLPTVLLFASALAACDRDARTAPRERDVALRPVLSDATQVDLAGEIDQAERRGTWSEVRQRWLGQRLRWTVTRHRALCASPAACHVAVFPIQRPAQHGWLPALELSASEWGKLAGACGAAERCELEFEGTLADFALSPELPTSLRFADVRVLSARRS